MTSLSNGEVRLRDVLEWAQEQAQFLTPTQAHVLMYLCANAFVSPDNPEEQHPGTVMSGRSSLRKIQMGTGLGQRAVRYALDALQDEGYVYAEHQPGHGKNIVAVFWSERFDEVREEYRAGVGALPKSMKREIKTKKKPQRVRTSGDVIPFPKA